MRRVAILFGGVLLMGATPQLLPSANNYYAVIRPLYDTMVITPRDIPMQAIFTLYCASHEDEKENACIQESAEILSRTEQLSKLLADAESAAKAHKQKLEAKLLVEAATASRTLKELIQKWQDQYMVRSTREAPAQEERRT